MILSKSKQEMELHRRIHSLFSRTPYGKKLRSEIRFSPYKPNSLSNSEWEKILGRDVNNLHHMSFTVRLTKYFINRCESPGLIWAKEISSLAKFDEIEKNTLVLAAQVHDWAEAKIGDIPAPLKTKDQEYAEISILRGMIDELLSKRYQQLVPQMHSAIENVIEKRDGKLGIAFDAIERMGYYKVGIRAWLNRNKFTGETRERLTFLAAGPTAPIKREREKLLFYAEVYPPIYEFLNSPINRRVIMQVLSSK